MTDFCSATRGLGILVVLFGITIVVLIVVLATRDGKQETGDTAYNSAVLTKKYPSLFRTVTQQQFYQQQYISSFENRTAVTHTDMINGMCFSQQQPLKWKRRDTSVDVVYHGCCRSGVARYTSPSHYNNYAGVNRILVQFDDVRQYFGVYYCSTYKSCSSCVCVQENSLLTAVVWKHGETDPDDIEDIETDIFLFDGCCKCVNV